jgi:AcrR family transcriptional regulator
MARRYQSPLRSAQAEQTRVLVLNAARRMLEREGPAALSLPRVARVARVASPTVYRLFPAMEDLLRALLDWLRPQIGMTIEGLFATDVADLPGENFPRFEANGRLLRALQDTPTFHQVRARSVPDRARMAAQRHAAAFASLDETQRRVATGAMYVFASPVVWRWLRDTWGLPPEDAAEAATWGIRALVAAARAGAGPAPPPPRPPRKRPNIHPPATKPPIRHKEKKR